MNAGGIFLAHVMPTCADADDRQRILERIQRSLRELADHERRAQAKREEEARWPK